MTWNNAQCQLLLGNGHVLHVTAQGATLCEQVPQLPPAHAQARPLFAAAARVLVLYAARRPYKAHLSAIRDYLAQGTITCRFEHIGKASDADAGADAASPASVALQFTNAAGDQRTMVLSARPARGDFPLCLLLNTDEIDQGWTCTVLASCVGDAIAEVRSYAPRTAHDTDEDL